jgi:hypothetical protein
MNESQSVGESREDAWQEARRHVWRKRILYTVIGIWLVLSLMWFTVDMLDDGTESLWFYWPMLGTGVGVVVTAIVLLDVGGLFGVEWERREMDKYLRRKGNPGGVEVAETASSRALARLKGRSKRAADYGCPRDHLHQGGRSGPRPVSQRARLPRR